MAASLTVSLEYQIGAQRYRVTITGATDAVCAVRLVPVSEDDAEGEPIEATAALTAIDAQTYRLTIDGRQYVTTVAMGSEAHYVAIGGQTFAVLPPDILEQQRRQGGGTDAHQHVTPPMPGQVISILVEVGDEVEAGQTVVVISAMKMESNLDAPHAGTVTAINTEVGAQVKPGDILVDIDARAD